ncbi:hypothetical protein OIU78_012149 [Salix suchowensis]|nr:hypothetical protein OIU78_012149 [Salix suchowensis]
MNYLGASFSSGQQNTPPLLMDPNNMVSANGLPEYPLAELLRSQVSQENEPSGWFYGLPRFRQAFMPPFNPVLKEKRPLLDTVLKEKLPTAPRDFKDIPSVLKSWIPKPTIALDLNKEVTGAKENQSFHLGPIATDENVEDDGIDMQTDVHEDIEELNALLYSDDDNEYTEDEEVTSTGHSPSTMTTHDKRAIGFEYEDDAESRCDNGNNLVSEEMGSESANKRMRKERIRETVSILQNLIPDGKGKDAVIVLEEAIQYLKSLKFKAKALGLDAP